MSLSISTTLQNFCREQHMKHITLSNKAGLILAVTLVSTCLAIAEEVELKLVVKEQQIPEALRKFTQGKKGDERNIYFLETNDMGLSRRNIILRLARIRETG